MNIVVLLKQTPDTESVIRIADDGKSVVTNGLKWILNPYDEFAVEAALRLKDEHGGSVTAVSCGPQRVIEAVRTALAMGADSGVLLDDPAIEGSDSLGIARALALLVRRLNPDIVLCGSRAVDYDLAQRGPMVAELLGWPHLPVAVTLRSDGKKVVIDRMIEGGKVTMEADLPALVTLGGSHAVWTPRYATLPGILKAKKKPLALHKLADLGPDASRCASGAAKIRRLSLESPPRRPAGRIVEPDSDTASKSRELARLLREEVMVI